MKIGIDISQLAYRYTGVANYLQHFVHSLVTSDLKNEYILFYSSLRRDFTSLDDAFINNVYPNVSVKKFRFPPTFLDLLWNKWHVAPIEWFIGDVDIFITSDWTEPPAKHAKKATIVYDVIVYKYPEETAEKIRQTQKRKLSWVKKESDVIFCISKSTKKDVLEILGIEEKRLQVAYPGL